MEAVAGYVRVSTDEQVDSGAGLEAQRRALRAEARRRGWRLTLFEDQGASGKSMNGRAGLQAALTAIGSGQATALVVTKLDRLSRSLVDFSSLMERARKEGWELVALDLGVDTTTPSGEMLANVLAVFAQFERRLIGQRTREGLAVKRGEGVRLGRPRVLSDETVGRIVTLRRSGESLPRIVSALTTDGVPTAHGGERWHSSTVRAVLRASARAEMGVVRGVVSRGSERAR